MNLSDSARARLDQYLRDLRRALSSLPLDTRDELVREIESHLIDACADLCGSDEVRMTRAIERMGAPGHYADAMIAEAMLRKAVKGFRPIRLFPALIRRMGLGLQKTISALVFVAGYLSLLIVAIAVLAKPIVPDSGLWLHPGGGWSLSLHAHENAREVLGWWIIPTGLAILAVGWFLLNRMLRLMLSLESRTSKQ